MGDWPHPDEIRFSILNPQHFGFKDFERFYYSAHYFSRVLTEDDPAIVQTEMTTGEKMNCVLWRERCKNIPSLLAIHVGVYNSGKDTSNAFIKYLYLSKDTAAIKYLDFAKQCTAIDGFLRDPWERNETFFIPKRHDHVQTAISQARITRDESIRLRYAFQAIRSSYYANDAETIKSVYAEFFSNRKEKNIIDYWAMHFRAITEPKGALKNHYAAQVFENAPDKRFMISMEYDKSVPIYKTLALAENKKEKAAVWLLSAIRNPGRTMEAMQQIAAVDPDHEGLAFLLLREINKLEDWIYTPYYTIFSPSVELDNRWSYNTTYSQMKNKISRDKLYAQQLLDFVNLHRIAKRSAARNEESAVLWKTAKAYLMFMTEDYAAAVKHISLMEKRGINNEAIKEQLDMIKALCLTAAQPIDSAIIKNEIKPILMHQDSLSNQKFILAIARELEYKNNTTDAALLLSKLNIDGNLRWNEGGNYVWWNGKNKQAFNLWDTYTNYFCYLDGGYSSAQVKNLINAIEHSTQQTDSFSIWKFSIVKKEKPRLYDLLGTKYIRENNLTKALATFEKVNDTLWTSEHQPFSHYLAANPFYTNLYNEHRKTAADTISYNKESITRTLIGYIKKAEDVTNKNRDYYYFLVANCYFNMTQYGNSWMMRRYFSDHSMAGYELPDGKDYFNCDYAKNYYLKARTVSKSKKFAALCLRMAGRCENYHLKFRMLKEKGYYYYDSEKDSKKLLNANIYYKKIKTQYPAYYNELISNCYSFEHYFNARN